MNNKGWIGVDLDGTLAEYHGWNDEIGAPIPAMVDRVKQWLAEGYDVRIMTARGASGGYLRGEREQYTKIRKFCFDLFGRYLAITHSKDMHMIALYDDRAIGVENNTGRLLSEPHDSLEFIERNKAYVR